MSPNPVDLNNGIRELREERPAEDLSARLVGAFRRPARASLRPRILIGAAILAASALSIWPRSTEGLAWAQSQASTASARRIHQRWVEPNGDLGGEMWTDGKRMADYSLNREGKIHLEYRNDGERMFFFARQTVKSPAPNAFAAGVISKTRTRTSRFGGMSPIDEYLKLAKADVLSQKDETTPDGPRTVYRIRRKHFGNMVSTIYAESETGLIRRIVEESGAQTFIDYPDNIEDELLAVENHRVQGVRIFEAEKEKEEFRKSMKNGLGTNNGITLRCVVMDQYGSLWILWTGWLPDGKMSRAIKLPNIPFSGPYGPKQYTTSFKPKDKKQYPLIDGKRIGAMAVTPKVVVGNTLKELRIPSNHGTAVFRNIPVLRMSSLSDVGLY